MASTPFPANGGKLRTAPALAPIPAGLSARPPAASAAGTVVLAFARSASPDNRFGMRDRIEYLAWTETAREAGIGRVILHHPEDGDDADEVGDFLLIYRAGAEWSSWGVARSGARYTTWRTADGGATWFASLAAALADVAGRAAIAPADVSTRARLSRQAAASTSAEVDAGTRPARTRARLG